MFTQKTFLSFAILISVTAIPVANAHNNMNNDLFVTMPTTENEGFPPAHAKNHQHMPDSELFQTMPTTEKEGFLPSHITNHQHMPDSELFQTMPTTEKEGFPKRFR